MATGQGSKWQTTCSVCHSNKKARWPYALKHMLQMTSQGTLSHSSGTSRLKQHLTSLSFKISCKSLTLNFVISIVIISQVQKTWRLFIPHIQSKLDDSWKNDCSKETAGTLAQRIGIPESRYNFTNQHLEKSAWNECFNIQKLEGACTSYNSVSN